MGRSRCQRQRQLLVYLPLALRGKCVQLTASQRRGRLARLHRHQVLDLASMWRAHASLGSDACCATLVTSKAAASAGRATASLPCLRCPACVGVRQWLVQTSDCCSTRQQGCWPRLSRLNGAIPKGPDLSRLARLQGKTPAAAANGCPFPLARTQRLGLLMSWR